MMNNYFRELAHLHEQLGDERFQALVSSNNTAKVRTFCDSLLEIAGGLPAEMTVSGRTYEILSFLREDEEGVNGYTMAARAKEMGAHLGQEDGEHLLQHQDEIPASLRDKVVFVFTDWGHPRISERISYVHWNAHQCRWVEFWDLLSSDHWNSRYQVLRRK